MLGQRKTATRAVIVESLLLCFLEDDALAKLLAELLKLDLAIDLLLVLAREIDFAGRLIRKLDESVLGHGVLVSGIVM